MSKNDYLKILLIPSFLLFIGSCIPEKKEVAPPIGEEKMIEILSAMFINEVKVIQAFDLSVQKTDYVKNYLYPSIFDSLEVSDSLFYLSFDYYNRHPASMSALMDKVVLQLETLKVDSIRHDEKGRSLEDAYKEVEKIDRMTKDRKNKNFNER